MSDTTEQETLEHRLQCELEALGPWRDVGATVHRFLQLARREGYVRYVSVNRSAVEGTCRPHSAGEALGLARVIFPLPPVTRTVPRVEPDPHADGEWAAHGGSILWRSAAPNGWGTLEGFIGLHSEREATGAPVTPERCRLWASLLESPTREETVPE